MGTPTSDLHEALVALLADGEWHDYHSVVALAAKTVQPGLAIRQCEKSRLSRVRVRYGEDRERTKPLSVNEQIRLGGRQLVQARLLNRAFEIDPPGVVPAGTKKRVRLRPKPSPVDAYRARRTPYLQVAFDLLADGEWQKLEDVLAAMMPLVPEETALRYLKRSRIEGGSPRAAQATHEHNLRVGRRGVAYAGLVGSRHLEIGNNGAVRMIRLKP